MKTISLLFALMLGPVLAAEPLHGSGLPGVAGMRSPENQEFQFMSTREFAGSDGIPQKATAYLWIPPACKKLRGVLVTGRNVPEHWLVGHPAIRAVCADSDLAILWACPTFLMVKNEDGLELGKFLQSLLEDLAGQSGYAELSTAPWLPVGESMHLLMVNRLTSALPERCIAGIQVKDARADRLKSDTVPTLSTVGTAGEWDQEKLQLTTRWQNVSTYTAHRKRRLASPAWPGSYLVEGGSGHFECTEELAGFLAGYIRAAVQARVPAGGGPDLRAVDLASGYLAGLPLPGSTPMPVTPYNQCPADQRDLPWYFTRELAQAAYSMAAINWQAKTQIPVFADPTGQPIAFGRRGITSPLPYTLEADGISFQLNATFLDRIPPGFVDAGLELGHAPGQPSIEWICGPVKPLGKNRFQIALDRSWPDSPVFFRVWHPGDATYRFSVQPGQLELKKNRPGTAQTITFEPLPDVPASVKEVRLKAVADSHLPVRFFVKAGPARIEGELLVFTKVPARTQKPVPVTVVAWQWGREGDQPVQMAPLVERTFLLTP